MPVATLPTYDEMWVHPAAVAALSGGVFTYVEAPPWDSTVGYDAGDHVVDGDGPYGGMVWQAKTDVPAGSLRPSDPAQTMWNADDCAYADRLKLFTATLSATWLLDSATNFRLHGEECWVEQYQVRTCTIRLRRGPVAEVVSVRRVSRCNIPGDEVIDWCWKSPSQISVCCGGCGFEQFGCGCDDNVVQIAYRIAANLPPGSEATVAWLATEYGKAAAGQTCALPERITSITRQGVSWTMLDPQDFYDKGLTGMARVDNWLVPVKRTLGGEMIDPLTSTRMHGERVDCADAPFVPEPEPVP